MKYFSFVIIGSLLLLNVFSCSNEEETGHTHADNATHQHGEANHTHNATEEEKQMDTEVEKTAYTKDETLTKSSKGIRLSLSFDDSTNTFTGAVENTTEEKLCGVVVTASPENGTAFDAINVGDLEAGQSKGIKISGEETTFENWSAKTSMSSCGNQIHTHENGDEHGDH